MSTRTTPKRGSETALDHIRAICLALPGTTEKLSHGAPSFFLKTGQYLYFVDNHHGDGRLAIWLAAPPGMQESLIEAEPQHFFRPPYVGVGGWVGVNLNTGLEWGAIAALIAEGHRFIEAKKKSRRRS